MANGDNKSRLAYGCSPKRLLSARYVGSAPVMHLVGPLLHPAPALFCILQAVQNLTLLASSLRPTKALLQPVSDNLLNFEKSGWQRVMASKSGSNSSGSDSIAISSGRSSTSSAVGALPLSSGLTSSALTQAGNNKLQKTTADAESELEEGRSMRSVEDAVDAVIPEAEEGFVDTTRPRAEAARKAEAATPAVDQIEATYDRLGTALWAARVTLVRR